MNKQEINELARIDFEAAIPREKIADMDRTADELGCQRRIVLGILSIGKREILSNGQNSEYHPDDAGKMWLRQAEETEAFIKHLEAQLECARAAIARMLILAATAAEAAKEKARAANAGSVQQS